MSPTSPRQPGAGGARHAACKVRRDSHNIHKTTSPPSSTSTNSSVSSSSNGAAAATNSRPAPPPRQKQQQQPVIIYTHSPKVIRTSPRDFMSIVQKLTGLDSPGPARGARNAGCSAAAAVAVAQEESSSSSSESCANTHAAAPHHYADPRLMPPPPPAAPLDAHFVAQDITLFAPGPSELQLCVPTGLYDQFPAIDAAPLGPMMPANMNGGAGCNGGPMFSPSMVEAMRTFPDN